MLRRDWLAAAAVAFGVAVGIGFGAMPRIEGFSVDILFWLRNQLTQVSRESRASHAVVVAIDEETYRTPPFNDLPNALWTREIGSILDALVAADAAVVGFDVIFPTSIERFVPRFDRDFLVSLRNAAQVDKVVLGDVQHQQFPIRPFAGQILAVGGQKNVRSVNLFNDVDEVIRRVPLTFARENGRGGVSTETSMALELAARATKAAPLALPGGGIELAGYLIPGSERNAVMVNFAGPDAIPTYSLADLHACAARGEADFFRAQFAGKVVFFGAVLDVEDRKLTSQRFMNAPEHVAFGPRCANSPMKNLFREDLVRDTTPGVYVLANAVNNLIEGNALRELDKAVGWAIVLSAALATAAVAMRFSAQLGATIVVAGTAAWIVAATLAFGQGVVAPLLAPPLASWLVLALLLGYRFTVTDRDRRLLRSSFALYLAPTLVDRLLESDRVPELGGEQRSVTLLFSDVAGFTALSETMEPADLVALMNEYLTAMTEIIEAEGGFVDKYVGDGIAAIFGAPVDDELHALHAVRAALACQDRLPELNRDSSAFRGHTLHARIGLSTGHALVGNVGSRRRFNYTAMGDVVNLASRLEGANKVYGTSILVSETTRASAGDAVVWREVDRVYVVGRDQPVSLFEPVAQGEASRPEFAKIRAVYASALAEYRAERFGAAVKLLETIASVDGPARALCERARRWLAAPPPDPWDAVTPLETK